MRELALDAAEIELALGERLGEIAPWDGAGRTRHVYPVTVPLPVSVQTIAAFWERNANNIGAHLQNPESLRGTRRLEREVVRDVATLLHCPDADGWLTTGGTEGNITGLWLARERLAAAGEPSPPVLGTALVHDSVHKACRLLRLGPLVEVPLQDEAVMDTAALRIIIEQLRTSGRRGVIVVATVGATLTGTCDPVNEIAAALPPGLGMHLHVDAAFAGLVLPFTAPQRQFDFCVPAVGSLVVDLHKMARIPLGAGVFLARAGSTAILEAQSICAHATDRTLLGSRPGALAAAAWAGLNALGRQGLHDELAYCLALKQRFLKRVASCPTLRVVHDPAVNAVGILDRNERGFSQVATRVYFMPHLASEDVDRIADQIIETMQARSRTVSR
jgi:tyrosine decarboxylase/aspartate 1-decarboxylase